jgi:hypothetical protein
MIYCRRQKLYSPEDTGLDQKAEEPDLYGVSLLGWGRIKKQVWKGQAVQPAVDYAQKRNAHEGHRAVYGGVWRREHVHWGVSEQFAQYGELEYWGNQALCDGTQVHGIELRQDLWNTVESVLYLEGLVVAVGCH